jgi:hypothetical protein
VGRIGAQPASETASVAGERDGDEKPRRRFTMTMPTEIPVSDDSFKTAQWIWRNLIPKKGQAATVQGELLRCVERLRWEAQNNGNGNWDDGFEAFITFLGDTLCAEPGMAGRKEAIKTDLALLRDFDHPYLEDDLYDRLTEHVVVYCRLHPRVIDRPVNPDLLR